MATKKYKKKQLRKVPESDKYGQGDSRPGQRGRSVQTRSATPGGDPVSPPSTPKTPPGTPGGPIKEDPKDKDKELPTLPQLPDSPGKGPKEKEPKAKKEKKDKGKEEDSLEVISYSEDGKKKEKKDKKQKEPKEKESKKTKKGKGEADLDALVEAEPMMDKEQLSHSLFKPHGSAVSAVQGPGEGLLADRQEYPGREKEDEALLEPGYEQEPMLRSGEEGSHGLQVNQYTGSKGKQSGKQSMLKRYGGTMCKNCGGSLADGGHLEHGGRPMETDPDYEQKIKSYWRGQKGQGGSLADNYAKAGVVTGPGDGKGKSTVTTGDTKADTDSLYTAADAWGTDVYPGGTNLTAGGKRFLYEVNTGDYDKEDRGSSKVTSVRNTQLKKSPERRATERKEKIEYVKRQGGKDLDYSKDKKEDKKEEAYDGKMPNGRDFGDYNAWNFNSPMWRPTQEEFNAFDTATQNMFNTQHPGVYKDSSSGVTPKKKKIKPKQSLGDSSNARARRNIPQ